ncbi:uncharacterized protein tnrc6c2 [Osmerus mordax]|uniref:uncharacterized protein tnrc6c2 n=1 Tax=Osmerus mordax TaxID=8014 RepID=UPI00350E92F8
MCVLGNTTILAEFAGEEEVNRFFAQGQSLPPTTSWQANPGTNQTRMGGASQSHAIGHWSSGGGGGRARRQDGRRRAAVGGRAPVLEPVGAPRRRRRAWDREPHPHQHPAAWRPAEWGVHVGHTNHNPPTHPPLCLPAEEREREENK